MTVHSAGLVERVLRREFDDVEVLFVAVDAVGRILDTVSEQVHRLVEVFHIVRLKEI
ncbi:hypothetical protein GCM10009000_034150 [Halobacterium noricense]|nr:hypothetical protein K6T36_15540 [Halobaculum roseum]